MLDERVAIEMAAVKRAFPRLVAGFGEGELGKQIDAHNRLLERHRQERSASFFACLLRKEGVQSPHMALLNILSLWQSHERASRTGREMIGRVFLLERHLARVARAGAPPTGYRDMIRDPEALDRLIAELDAGVLFAWLGRFQAHARTVPGDARNNKNYDVDWERWGYHLRADVKWFDTWVLKRRGADTLDALLALVRPDINHMVYVSIERGPYGEQMLLDAAEEVVFLYEAAMRGPGLRAEVHVYEEEGGRCVAFRPRKTHPQVSVVARVKEVTVYAADARPGPGEDHNSPFIVSESGAASADEDINTVRRCLLDAAAQVPPGTTRCELSAIIVGSRNPQDEEDVHATLHGTPEVDSSTGHLAHVPGFFSPGTGEHGLDHVQAVYFYSLGYRASFAGHVIVWRHVRLFLRDTGVSEEQRTLARTCRLALTRPTLLRVSGPTR